MHARNDDLLFVAQNMPKKPSGQEHKWLMLKFSHTPPLRHPVTLQSSITFYTGIENIETFSNLNCERCLKSIVSLKPFKNLNFKIVYNLKKLRTKKNSVKF